MMEKWEDFLLKGEVDGDAAVDYLDGYSCVIGTDTKYWYRYAWDILEKKGLTKITPENPLELIYIHAAVLAMLTEEFQTKILGETELFEYDYGKYLELPLHLLTGAYESFFKAEDDDELPLDEDEAKEELMARVMEGDRDAVAKALGLGTQEDDAFPALVLTTRFPSSCYNDFADSIERQYPVVMDDLRDRDSFDSYEEYKKFLDSDDCADFVYPDGFSSDDPDLQCAFEWVMDGCPRLPV